MLELYHLIIQSHCMYWWTVNNNSRSIVIDRLYLKYEIENRTCLNDYLIMEIKYYTRVHLYKRKYVRNQ